MNRYIKEVILLPISVLYYVAPKLVVRTLFRIKCGYHLKLDSPSTYCEKINWMKFNYFHPLMPICADKLTARRYIEENGYGDYLPKILWSGKNPENIPFDELPEQFVIKTTSGSGNNIVCISKANLDRKKSIRNIRRWLKRKHFVAYGEWFYNETDPSIIVEEFIYDPRTPNQPPPDYKLFYFNNLRGGDVGCVAVDTDRFSLHRRTIYDRNWMMMPEVSFDFPTDTNRPIPKPMCFEKMIECAKVLSKPFIHLRVDFYVIGNRFYLGELTFMNGAGFDKITPYSMDKQMGDWIDIIGKAIPRP